mgnify:FL=1
MALYNLGYRPSWEPPILRGEKYEVKFFMPNSTPITFLTGPNGKFSVFSLWLDMRIICAEKGEPRSINGTAKTNPMDNPISQIFMESMFSRKTYQS